jgi:hypothetical protein
MTTRTQNPTPPPETKATRTATDGGTIGKAINKLLALNEAEQIELETTPATVREKFSARRQALLDGLEPHIKQAVLAAASAMNTPKAAE